MTLSSIVGKRNATFDSILKDMGISKRGQPKKISMSPAFDPQSPKILIIRKSKPGDMPDKYWQFSNSLYTDQNTVIFEMSGFRASERVWILNFIKYLHHCGRKEIHLVFMAGNRFTRHHQVVQDVFAFVKKKKIILKLQYGTNVYDMCRDFETIYDIATISEASAQEQSDNARNIHRIIREQEEAELLAAEALRAQEIMETATNVFKARIGVLSLNLFYHSILLGFGANFTEEKLKEYQGLIDEYKHHFTGEMWYFKCPKLKMSIITCEDILTDMDYTVIDGFQASDFIKIAKCGFRDFSTWTCCLKRTTINLSGVRDMASRIL